MILLFCGYNQQINKHKYLNEHSVLLSPQKLRLISHLHNVSCVSLSQAFASLTSEENTRDATGVLIPLSAPRCTALNRTIPSAFSTEVTGGGSDPFLLVLHGSHAPARAGPLSGATCARERQM